MTQASFVHLGLHTEFSLKDSLLRIKPLIKTLKERGMHSVGISDASNMFGAIRLYQNAMSNGIKPIISAELSVASDIGLIGNMTLIAKNQQGYLNLIKLVSLGYEKGIVDPSTTPVIQKQWIRESSDGLIALSGGRLGAIGQMIIRGEDELAKKELIDFKDIFGDRYYLEIQRISHPDDDNHNEGAVKLAIETKTPVVATNCVRFLDQSEYDTHEIRTSISQKLTVNENRAVNSNQYTPEQYLKTPQQMIELFRDIPSAIENTVQIANRCSVDIELGKSYLPKFPTPDNSQESDYLTKISKLGLKQRLRKIISETSPNYLTKVKEYEDRLDFELKVINDMGFPGYFLIVADFMQWCKKPEVDIPVGPGRGSGAGSLVAYSLQITNIDPLPYDLLFERFLNPERVSMPDFDIDFCMDRREEVIKYVSDKYGHKAVSQIITFGTMAAKGVVKDVTRALGHPYSLGERISRLIPELPGTKLSDAIEESEELKILASDPEVKEVIYHSLKLEGLTRQTGKHAGGVLISDGPLTKFTPTYSEADGSGFVSQYDKNDVETAGLVKFDFLGLRTLTVIQSAVRSVNRANKSKGLEDINIDNIDINDAAVFNLLKSGKTAAVFQVESRGMRDLLRGILPDTMEDLIALVALFRPGPLQSGMVENFINRKHGREELAFPDKDYQHELLRPILEPTYGIILYQEQVMQIAQVLSGYTLGGADMLRRAMGKKKPEEMAKQREVFRQGAINNGIDGDLSMNIFDLVEKFAGYGFNKSHSAAYALISYQTAWLKQHHPEHFMAAVLSSDMDRTDRVVGYINECKDIGLEVKPPSINESVREFTSIDGIGVRYGFGAIKGLGDSAIKAIIKERNTAGRFTSLSDLCSRCALNKTALEGLIYAGALDEFGSHRASLIETYPKAIKIGKQIKNQAGDNQSDLFGDLKSDQSLVSYENAPKWSDQKRLYHEKCSLGLYITGHPINDYKDDIQGVISGKLSELVDDIGSEDESTQNEPNLKEDKRRSRPVVIGATLMLLNVRSTARGHYASALVDDGTGQIEVIIYNKTYNDFIDIINEDANLLITGRIEFNRKTGRSKIIANDIETVDSFRDRSISHIQVDLNPRTIDRDSLEKIQETIRNQEDGPSPVMASYQDGNETKLISLGNRCIHADDEFIHRMESIVGENTVFVVTRDKANNPESGSSELSQEALKVEGIQTRKERSLLMAQAINDARTAMEM